MAKSAAFPANESRRLARIQELHLLESRPDEVFDEIVGLATQVFDVPIALVSIIGRHRQWFRARVGIDVQETPREHSLCAHAILEEDLFLVCDAARDERFRDNPYVVGDPGVRFYAAVPLTTADSLGLGALCIIDTKPKPPLSEEQVDMLRRLGKLAMSRIEHMHDASYVDTPTGLFNRFRLEEDVEHLLADGHDLLLVAADVISPLFYNDIVKALGFTFSRSLVLAIKTRLQEELPGVELYKISPSRFAFILDQTRLDQAEALFARLARAFDEPVICGEIPVRTQLGIGALHLSAADETRGDWLRLLVSCADEARERGVPWSYYSPQQDFAQQRAFKLLSALAEAVRKGDQFRLVYQPRVDLHSGRCTSVETFIRWTHPVLGEIGPAEFIPLAEKTALIRPISLWVLRNALEQLALWQRQGLRFKLAINVSATDLDESLFTDELAAALERLGIDPSGFELEFTESALMRNPEAVRAQLERIRALGVEVALDDFGAGYSNWAYVRDLPANTVKLDQSFLRNLLSADKDKRVVRTMIGLAKQLGYCVVAEGIESAEVQALMKQWGCNEGQGYLFARPMPAAELLNWLAQPRPLH